MAMYCDLFRPACVGAKAINDTARLRFEDDAGNSFNVFMPMTQAQAMADAFNNPARITALEGFIADFAKHDFEAIRSPGWVSPEDVADDVTDLITVEAWQDDARALIGERFVAMMEDAKAEEGL